jgi:hypothetical protein
MEDYKLAKPELVKLIVDGRTIFIDENHPKYEELVQRAGAES